MSPPWVNPIRPVRLIAAAGTGREWSELANRAGPARVTEGVADATGGALGAFIMETALTALFVFVILLVTEKGVPAVATGVAIGAALTTVHLVGIPVTGTSVNPARSIGPAIFSGSEALEQLWLFILAPLVGGLIAVVMWRVTRTPAPEQAA